jgi:cytoskeletal protein CcmA (bactofilin family)
MGEVVVARGERVRLGAVDGDLRVDREATLDTDAAGRISVSGECRFKGDVTVRAPLACAGDLRMRGGHMAFANDVTVGGTFRGEHVTAEVGGALSAGHVDVDRELRLLGPARAQSFRVGGVLEAAQRLEGPSVSVGGRFRAHGEVQSRKVDVGGEASIETCELGTLHVGGQAVIGGGTVSEALEVGGQLEVARPLVFGSIEVGGIARLGGGGKGRSIEVGGMFSSGGDLEFGSLEVGGLGRIDGSASGESLELGGMIDVRGSLKLTGRMEVGGRATVGQELVVGELTVGGELRAVLVRASGRVDISGSLITRDGTFAKELTLGRHSEVRGAVTAERVVVGRHCRAQSIGAGSVVVGAHSRIERIVADEVELERRCEVGELQYVRSLKVGDGVEFGHPPVQVASRPSPAA